MMVGWSEILVYRFFIVLFLMLLISGFLEFVFVDNVCIIKYMF